MIEFNKPYLYKNKIVFPAVVENGNIICFDSKGVTIFVKNESLLTKIEDKPKIVEPNYIPKEVKVEPIEEVKEQEQVSQDESVIEQKDQVVEKIEAPTVIVAEPQIKQDETKDSVIENNEEDGYDDFYEFKVPSPKKKRVNIIEKSDYI
jgi:hypothetical protein